MIDDTYSSPEACRLAGCTFRQLDYWDRTGLVSPSVPAHGSGSQRRYSAEDVTRLRVVVLLRDAGLSLLKIRRFVNGDDDAIDTGAFDRAADLMAEVREPVPA